MRRLRAPWTSQTHVMGSGTSRGKKVVPECVREVNGTEPGAAAKQSRGPFTRLKLLSAVRNARPDRDSDFSETDMVLADDVDPGSDPPKTRAFICSRTYGLCLIREEDAEEVSSDPRVARAADVHKRNTRAFMHAKRHAPEGLTQHSSSSQKSLERGTLENVPTTEKPQTSVSCPSSPVTMLPPLYDGSEEELMDTIEREFS